MLMEIADGQSLSVMEDIGEQNDQGISRDFDTQLNVVRKRRTE